MEIRSSVSLKHFNTFGIDVNATSFSEFTNTVELQQLLSDPVVKNANKLVLGGGSNILFTRNFEGVVLKNNIQGIEKVDEDETFVYIKAGGGVNWHSLVMHTIDKNLGGIENLSLIPGNAGAAPIQNIGAYGVELKDSFHSLEAVMLDSGNVRTYFAGECNFGYRDSIFKREMKWKTAIVNVTLRLRKDPILNISYGAIEQELLKTGVKVPTVKDVSQAVCSIRRSKLPDPAVIGNAGSFFKNPEVDSSTYQSLHEEYPNISAYPLADGNYKLAAGWLIEQCGWKGRVVGNTGSHKNQALVLVNYGNATGAEILNLARDIQQSVKEKFNVTIEPEVNVI